MGTKLVSVKNLQVGNVIHLTGETVTHVKTKRGTTLVYLTGKHGDVSIACDSKNKFLIKE